MSFAVTLSPEGRAGPLLSVPVRPVPFLIPASYYGNFQPATLKVPFIPSEVVNL